MTVNSKTSVVLQGYQRGIAPNLEEGITKYLQDELQRIETSLRSISSGSVEVLDEEPKNPLIGMVKYNIAGWDPIGDSSEGLVVYDGSSWSRI